MIGILKCDTIIDLNLKSFGDYDEIFRNFLNLKKKDIKCFDCVNNKFPTDHELEVFGGFIITGSSFSVYEHHDWIENLKDLIIKMDEMKVNLLGICFGHQIIANAFGCPVEENPEGWEVSLSTIKLNEIGQELFNRKQLRLHQMHKDIVTNVPEDTGLKVTASNKKSEIQGLLKDEHIITLQGHPEYFDDIIENFFKEKEDLIPEEVIEEGREKFNKSNSEKFLSKFFKKFLKKEFIIYV